jgi:Na+-transporting methylmalonyl-CoA/oxaloacetate decarboxylase gamma subunit
MIFGCCVVLSVLAILAVLVILWEPSAARLLADGIERRAKTAVSILRSHAEAREAARVAYRRVYRFCREGSK